MRNLNELDHFQDGPWKIQRDTSARVRQIYGSTGDDKMGVFRAEQSYFNGHGTSYEYYTIIATAGEGWDHVSVSTAPHRPMPGWDAMDRIKRIFFKPDETAMQLHVPPKDHVNVTNNCLHLWRPHNVEIPRPPQIFV